MKKTLMNLFLLIFLSISLTAQKEHNIDTVLYSNYKISPMKRFVNEDIYPGNKNFHWKSSFYNVINISLYSNPQNFYKTDFLTLGNQFFNVNLLSFYTFKFPMNASKSHFYSNLFYTTSLGLKFPILSGRNYDMSIGFDYYWPINFKRENKDSTYYDNTTLLEGTKTTYKNTPNIIDSRLDFKLNVLKYVGISIFCGYRNQFTKWYATDRGRKIYSNNISGSYFGLSLSYNIYIRTNKGLERWEKSKTENTSSAYAGFISEYPGSHYEKEALQRKEDASYLAAVKYNVVECNNYLSEYPNGRYIENVKQKIVKIEYDSYNTAVTGSISDCEKYLQIYRSGKYTEEVKRLLIEKQDKLEADDYSRAINGSIADCDYYLKNYQGGKFVKEVISAKENKIETGYYNTAKDGSYNECDIYMKKYPGGKYFSEVTLLRKVKYNESEEESYKSAASGNYKECENYMSSFPNGKHYREVDIMHQLIKYNTSVFPSPLELVNPGCDKIEILKNSYTGHTDFTYDVIVISQKGNTVYVNPVTSPNISAEFIAVPLMDNMSSYSSFGKPNTRIDITLMKGGFEYDNKIWYPTYHRDAIIICLKDKILGFNVRFVNKKIAH
jgi:hypothetical protein